MAPSRSLLPTLLTLPLLVSAITFDCEDIRTDETSFDLRELGGPHSLSFLEDTPPSMTNTTYTLDICRPIRRSKGKAKGDECPFGTRVCAIKSIHNTVEDTTEVAEAIPIAGEFTTSVGRSLDPKVTRLKGSASNSDTEQEGLRVEFNGGRYPLDKSSGTQQKAIIEFLCDPNLTGNEGFGKVIEQDGDDDEPDADEKRSKKRVGEDEEKDPKQEDPKQEDPNAGKSLEFVSYKDEGKSDNPLMVLRLNWRTRYACEEAKDNPSGKPSKGSAGWGFFTWFIIVLFMLVAGYIIFGSWMNYSRYGARGWDLLPHGDSIRDMPYLIQDWGRSCLGMMKGGGGGSRGGYSAV